MSTNSPVWSAAVLAVTAAIVAAVFLAIGRKQHRRRPTRQHTLPPVEVVAQTAAKAFVASTTISEDVQAAVEVKEETLIEGIEDEAEEPDPLATMSVKRLLEMLASLGGRVPPGAVDKSELVALVRRAQKQESKQPSERREDEPENGTQRSGSDVDELNSMSREDLETLVEMLKGEERREPVAGLSRERLIALAREAMASSSTAGTTQQPTAPPIHSVRPPADAGPAAGAAAVPEPAAPAAAPPPTMTKKQVHKSEKKKRRADLTEYLTHVNEERKKKEEARRKAYDARRGRRQDDEQDDEYDDDEAEAAADFAATEPAEPSDERYITFVMREHQGTHITNVDIARRFPFYTSRSGQAAARIAALAVEPRGSLCGVFVTESTAEEWRFRVVRPAELTALASRVHSSECSGRATLAELVRMLDVPAAFSPSS